MPADPRQSLITAAHRMAAEGLNRGTAGNLSLRAKLDGVDGFYVTPTGMSYDSLQAEDIPFVKLADGSHVGRRLPSSGTSTPPGRKRARCCTPIPPSPRPWPACAGTFPPSTT